jgi:TrmH family RNA methyltransferase
MKRISSRQNPLIARFRAAIHNEDRQSLLLDGPHLVGEAIAAGIKIDHVMVSSGDQANPEIAALLDSLERHGSDVSEATSAVMAAVSPVRSPSAIVALGARPAPAGVFGGPDEFVVIACGVQDPGNVGAIVRVAEAAAATGFIAAGPTADPFAWKALRGSMGSALRLPIAVDADEATAVAEARTRGCRVAAAVPRGGTPLFGADLTGPLALLVGAEGAGLPAGLADSADIRLTIPMAPRVESLNTAVSAALMLYEAMRQRASGWPSAPHHAV